MIWMEFKCEGSLVPKTTETRQHFFVFPLNGLAQGFNRCIKTWQAFFILFADYPDEGETLR